ncbi:hypothetical protein Patl1_37395 [Pistacia atlantica]|nr:hypothetical protein Patl1_37395 [Pistacia atlantica]
MSFKPSMIEYNQTLTSAAAKLGKHSSTYLAANYNCKNATIDVKVDLKSLLSASLSFSGKFSPSTRTIASLKLPHYSSSELKISYFHEHVTLATSILLNQSPAIMLSASIGTPKIALSVEAKYKTESCSASYNASISLANPKSNASIILANQGDLLKASYVYCCNQPKEISVGAEIHRRFSKKESTFTVGGSCSVDHLTTLKMKLNNYGKLETLLSHKIRPKSCLSISGEVDLKALDRIPRIGLAVALML